MHEVSKYLYESRMLLTVALGWIPLMLPFGFSDALTSTLDYMSVYDMVRIAGRELIGNLLIGKI